MNECSNPVPKELYDKLLDLSLEVGETYKVKLDFSNDSIKISFLQPKDCIFTGNGKNNSQWNAEKFIRHHHTLIFKLRFISVI